MKRIILLIAAMLLGIGGFAALNLPAAAEAPVPPSECPGQLPDGQQTLVCHCSAEDAGSGMLWGFETYTADSAMCLAAAQMGVIGEDGGMIRVDTKPGQRSYKGSTRNGIASADWTGPWARSFSVGRTTWANTAALDYPATPSCPDSANALATAGTTLTCRCSADAAGIGSVWGSGTYTTDSAVCRAAQHAGLIGPRGGIVSLRAAPGRASYHGSEANGVSTGDWGSYPSSFEFAQ